MKKNGGFTLLEIIVVIILIGVLVSLALPRFFRGIEFSRSTEALAAIAVIRQALERCYVQRNGDYTDCTNYAILAVEDPGQSPNAHFSYTITNQSATGYTITALRNALDNPQAAGSTVVLTQDATGVTRTGTGVFLGVQ